MSVGVAALRGTLTHPGSADKTARRSAARRPGPGGDDRGPLLPAYPARAAALFALVLFGSLHWMQMLDPSSPGRAWAATGIAGAGIAAFALLRRQPFFAAVAGAILLGTLLGLAAAAAAGGASAAAVGFARLRGRTRLLETVASVCVAVGLLALSLLAAGIPANLLTPGRWGELASGIQQGVEGLPGVRVPYKGIEEWIRLVIPLGATLLAAAATILACWPRANGRFGFMLPALVCLLVLYAVPTIALVFGSEFVRGALLALLVLAFLRLERLRKRDGRAAAGLLVAAAVLGLIAAPAIDRDEPLWDYEAWALGAASSKTTEFSWDHNYGPLDWPRDGREVLRVKARNGSYWKAQNLDFFDGRTWQAGEIGRREASTFELPPANTFNQRLVSDRPRVGAQPAHGAVHRRRLHRRRQDARTGGLRDDPRHPRLVADAEARGCLRGPRLHAATRANRRCAAPRRRMTPTSTASSRWT